MPESSQILEWLQRDCLVTQCDYLLETSAIMR